VKRPVKGVVVAQCLETKKGFTLITSTRIKKGILTEKNKRTYQFNK